MKRIYICLVSDQPVPNMIPAFMKKFYPDKVILLQTPEKKNQAQRLKEIFERHNMDVLIKSLENSIAFDCIKNVIEKIIYYYNGYELVLNISGGTKIMALAAYTAFLKSQRIKYRILYVNTAEKMILQIKPKIEMYDFEDSINVEDYLYSYGYIAKSNASTNYVKLLGKLIYDNRNYLFNNNSEINSKIITFFENNNIVYEGGGFWLEYYAYYCVSKYIKDEARLKCNINIISPNLLENELDVVFTYNNKLFVIECKSGCGMISGSKKLNVLGKQIGGDFVRLMLISARNKSEIDYSSLYGLDVKIIYFDDLKRLDEIILQWISE